MANSNNNLIPYLSKRFVQKNPRSSTSRIMKSCLKEAAKLAKPEKPKTRVLKKNWDATQ